MAPFYDYVANKSIADTHRNGPTCSMQTVFEPLVIKPCLSQDCIMTGSPVAPSSSSSATASDLEAAASLITLTASDSTVTQDVEMEVDEESTESKLGLLISLYPDADPTMLLNLLVSAGGSVAEAKTMFTV